MKNITLIIAVALVLLAINEVESAASFRVVLSSHVEGETLRYRCVGKSLLHRSGCYELSSGDYLGTYWTLNPEKAEAVPSSLRWILGVDA